MKRKLFFGIFLVSISFLNAQIYTPNGTIQGSSGNNYVGIGANNLPLNLLSVHGSHGDSRILLHSYGGGSNATEADLMLWASEPGLTYGGVGIGNNVHNFNHDIANISLLNPARGGSYIRLLDNSMLFNIVSSSGIDKQSLSINAQGNVGIGTLNPSNDQGWDKVLEVAGSHHSKILATAENSLYKVGVFSHTPEWYGGGFIGTPAPRSVYRQRCANVSDFAPTRRN